MSPSSKRAPRSVIDGPCKHNDYSLQFSRWFLMSIGVWPQTGASPIIERLSAIILVPVCTTAVAVITIPCLLYTLFEADSVQSRLSNLAPLIHRLMGSMNYWTLLSRSDDIRGCIRHMEADWRCTRRSGDRLVMLQYARTGRFVTVVCAMFMQVGACLYNVAIAIRPTNMVIGNASYMVYPLTCPAFISWRFVDTRFSPLNEIMLGVQFTSTFVTGTSTVCVCSLAAVFAMHACGQLNLLNTRFNELAVDDCEHGDSAERKLGNIVEHHLRVLSFVAQMESIMHKACFVELIGCTLNMCLIGYSIIMNWAAFDGAKITSHLVVYLSMGFNIFIFCYIGEIITEQCKSIGEMAYMSDWYKLRQRTALGLVLVIGRSSSVFRLTAGKFFHLSIATFGDVVKSSMVYLNMLQTAAA